jgi:hypothetical protein
VCAAGEPFERQIRRVNLSLNWGNFHIAQRMMSSACNAPACFIA